MPISWCDNSFVPYRGSEVLGAKLRYFPHIDGLRAIAILPVVAFHVDVAIIPGGFTGVDIFFVISGYLITSIIIREIRGNTFSILEFYKRRALRILPAYVAMTLFVLIASYWISLPDEAERLGKSVISSAFFISNIYFWRITDYFSPDSAYEPMIHAWTLSVEEQYYILIPILLLIVARFFGAHFVTIFALLTVASFGLAAALLETHELATFYLLPMRAWEFGAGSLVALAGIDISRTRRFGTPLALIGLVLIAWSMFGLSQQSSFPGPNAAFAVVGATLLIVFGPGSFVGNALSSRPAVALGRISYSLYLWHWPLIVFYRSWFGPELHALEIAFLIAVSLVVATFSFFFIEQPFRTSQMRGYPGGRVTGIGLACLLFVGAFGLTVTQIGNRWGGHSTEIRQMASFIGYRASNTPHPCFIHARTPGLINAYDPVACLPEDATKHTILFMGDSHAEHLMSAFADVYSNFNWQFAGATGCFPNPDSTKRWYCPSLYRDFIFNNHLPKGGVDTVILSMRWTKENLEKADRLLQALFENVNKVILIGPTPEYEAGFPRLKARAMTRNQDGVADYLRPEVQDLDQIMIARVWPDDVEYISIYDQICPSGNCRETLSDGTPLISDYGHYTASAAREIIEKMRTTGILTLP